MTKFLVALQAWFTARAENERGATMVEYGLMVALIAVVCIGIVTTVGTDLASKFSTVADAL